jgi:hypothetical protein
MRALGFRGWLGRPQPWGRRDVGVLALGLLCAVAVPATGANSIYRWTDETGTIHYTQGLESVPARHRPAAVLIGHNSPPGPPEPAPAPAPRAVVGSARVGFTPGEPIMVSARINDAGSVQLMLDTGASRTVISPNALTALGVSHRDAHRGKIRGVTGEAEVLAVRVDSIDISGARHGPLMVVSHDTGFGRGDGLLGRDFLDQFLLTIDNAAGVVTLAPR